MTDSPNGRTAIILRTRSHPLKFLVAFLYKPFVTIDGSTSVLPWGEHCFEVTPGPHEVRIALGGSQGLARVDIDVQQGQTVRLNYRGPPNYLMEGKIKIVT